MKPIAEFLPFVLPFARGASEPVAVNAIRNAAIEFCKRTKVWQELTDSPYSIQAGDPCIELTPPAQAELVQILQVWYHDTPLDPANEGWMAERGISPDRRGTPMGYHQQQLDDRVLNEFVLVPVPATSEAQAIRVRSAWMPSRAAKNIPDALFVRYAEEIAYGALGRLHQIDEDWVKPEFGQSKLAQFEQAIGVAVSAVAKANVRSRRRTKGSFF